MKKIFTLIISLMAIAVPMFADESKGNTASSTPITLRTHVNDDQPNPTVHRAPMRICVEAWYDTASDSIIILYDGEAGGEVCLYKDGMLVDNSAEINTTFTVHESGFYTIEISSESWSATGSIEL